MYVWISAGGKRRVVCLWEEGSETHNRTGHGIAPGVEWLPSSLQGVGSNGSDAPGEPGALGVKYFGQASGGKLASPGEGFFFADVRIVRGLFVHTEHIPWP
jgi:hypothetical protein